MKSIILFILLLSNIFFGVAQVKIYEGTEVIPTYKKGVDEVSPMFYTGRGVQGAQGHIYPYASQANLGDKLEDVTYNMVYLENDYIIVKILPAFGGRLFSAIDKTNGHELFHTNSVIKPDLIGTLGAWVSGGIEWCFPHHHRTTTMLPSDYRLVKNEDGSATVWIGETEKTIRIKGSVGVTLHPGRSYIETDYRINSTSTLTKTFLFWANVAITANKDFRTFWPPSQEIGVFHNNRSFVNWPFSNETNDYGRTSYKEGVDLTWWKNHPNPVSFFMWHPKEGFIGGYDYGVKAGTVHVGDVYENSASKLWQFGPGLQGQNARRKLTDDGKAYVELMTGTFSNNQPDYSWIAPHSVKDAKNFWYPLRDIEVVKNSTINASVTLQMRNSKTVFYGFNTTTVFKNAKYVLKYGDNILKESTIDIDPATPFTTTYKSKKVLDEYKLYVELKDGDNNLLVDYKPFKAKTPELPKTQDYVQKASEIESVEDLYLAGRFVEQFNRPGINPDDYYLKALKKSPNDYRSNLALGIRRLNQNKYKEALDYFNTAANKLKVKYYQPKEGELFYYMAIAQRHLGQAEDAYDNFAQATWYYEWFSAGYYQLAQLESIKGNYEKALEYIKNAYSTNTLDGRIVVLYSAILRKLKKGNEAENMLDTLIDYDPLNFSAIYEKARLKGETSMNKWHGNMQNVDNNYLEIITNYMNAGFYEEGEVLLASLQDPTNALVNYYLAYFNAKLNNKEKAFSYLKKAESMSLEYCFPYREESEVVLNYAINQNPNNVSAFYLLGNLLYDNRPEDAMQAWELASNIDNSLPMVSRNLAYGAFYNDKNMDNAISFITKAIEGNRNNPLWYSEMSKYYDASNADFKECLAVLRSNLDVVKRDVSAPKTYVKLLNLNGEYDEAIKFLNEHHFRTWEGGREIYWHYVDTHVLKAKELMGKGKDMEAVKELELALLYPENLEVGKASDDEKNAMIYYYMGLAYENLSKNKKAKEYFQKSVDSNSRDYLFDLVYYKGNSYKKLGDLEQANTLFEGLIAKGKELMDNGDGNRLIAVEEASVNQSKRISFSKYLQALGNLGLGKETEAKEFLVSAQKEYKNNLWVNVMLNN